jgi:predicted nucleic acid-binding protein
MVVKLYLDTCIFIAYYFDKGSRNYHVLDSLEKLKKSQKTILVTSDFTFTEFTKAAQDIKGVSTEDIFKIVSIINRVFKIGGLYPFKVIPTEGKFKDYSFEDFFVELQETLLHTRPGIADAIHYQIMKNNKITRILTFDKKDFSKLPDVIVICPDEIDQFIQKIMK